ncbi:MAG TPA: hypothetical protein VES88_10920 [Gemmatimonadaceae bacterium]|nr:hypothetical protein [Gemmatimonadaceae bacterium]
MFRSPIRKLALLAVLTAVVSTVAIAGPPWIAIEYPANPHDPGTRGALLTVRTYHHGELISYQLAGTAEGIVNGRRQSIPLDIRRLPQAGMYAVRFQKPAQGNWMLVITSSQQNGAFAASALVTIDSGGGVASVSVPSGTIENGRWRVPRRVASAEIDAMLKNAAATTVARRQ